MDARTGKDGSGQATRDLDPDEAGRLPDGRVEQATFAGMLRLIAAGLDPLRFPNVLEEAEYQKHRYETLAKYSTIVLAFGMVAASSYALFDLESTNAALLLEYRFGVFVPVLAILLAVSLFASARPLWELLVVVGIVACLILAATAGFLYEGTSAFGITTGAFTINAILILVIGTGVAPLRMIHCALVCLFTLAAFLATTSLVHWTSAGQELSQTFNVGVVCVGCIFIAFSREQVSRRLFHQEASLKTQHNLLKVILNEIVPSDVALSIRQGTKVPPKAYGEVTILFADLVGFTELSSRIGPRHLVEILDRLFTQFDGIVERFDLEKVKTIGDAYMVVGGSRDESGEKVRDTILLAYEMIAETHRIARESHVPMELRVGIHLGSVIGGVIGRTKMAFDYWGDAVNVASRLESAGVPGQIQVSDAVYLRAQSYIAVAEKRRVDLKGKGLIDAYLLAAGPDPS